MLFFFLHSSLYAQPCSVPPANKQILLKEETVQGKEWTTTQKLSQNAHIMIASNDTLPVSTIIRASTSTSQDGYLIQLSDSSLQVFRKEPYKNIPITQKIPLLQKSYTSMHILQDQAAMELWICNKDRSIAHTRWEDTAFDDGFLHIEHSKNLQKTQVSYHPKSTIMQAIWPQDILHSSALLKIEGDELPPALEKGRISNPLEPGQWSLLTDRTSISALLPYKENIVSISKSIPYWAINTQSLPPLEQEEKLILLAQENNARLHQIGKTHQGRPIWAIQLAPSTEEKPSVLFVGGVQGNNIHSIQETFALLHRFLNTQDGLIQLWKEKLDLWFIPTLNVDGSHYFWYRNTHEGAVVPIDTNQDGSIDIGEGIQLLHNTDSLFSKSPHQTRGTAPYSTPELRALSSLSHRISPALSVLWSNNRTALQEDLNQQYGTYPLALSPKSDAQKEIESQLNHLLAGPAIRIIVADTYNHPIQANVVVNQNKQAWSTKQDGLWVHPVSEHKTYNITISAPSYKDKTIRVQTNRLYRVQLHPSD